MNMLDTTNETWALNKRLRWKGKGGKKGTIWYLGRIDAVIIHIIS